MQWLLKRLTTRYLAASAGGLLLILVALQIFFFVEQKKQLIESRMWVTHSHHEIHKTEMLLTKLKDAELGQRGYVLTGDKNFLDIYYFVTEGNHPHQLMNAADSSTLTISEILDSLRQMMVDDPVQMREFYQLEQLVGKKLVYIQLILDLYDQKGYRAAIDIIQKGEGKQIMDNIRMHVAKMIRLEQAQLESRKLHDAEIEDRLTYYIIGAAVVTYGILSLIILVMIGFFSRGRQFEHKLQLKEAQFKAAVMGSMDGFFLFKAEYDRKGRVDKLLLDYANPVAEKMLQKDINKIIGQPIETILAPENEHFNALDVYRSILERQTTMEREYVAVSGPLQGHTLQKQAIPLPHGIAICCRDITERKYIEQMKNEFISTVSHELRTPLTSIRGSLGLVIGGVAGLISDEIKNLLSIAYNNCERLTRLINDMLDIEKMESGQISLNVRSLPLGPLLEQSLRDNQAYADKYDINIVLDHQHNDPHVRVVADSDRLLQVLANLLSNAIKFSPPKSKVILRSQICPAYARIEVCDHGAGIPEVFRKKIFQKFAQQDSSDTRQKGGTGLGLAITKTIVEQMGGQIGFDTQIGHGTVFHFTLPLAPAAERPPVVQTPEPPRPVTTRDTKSIQSILVCEDDPVTADFLALVIRRAGYSVDIAYTVQDAMDHLRQHPYAAMTLDLVVPDDGVNTYRDGLAFVQKLRSDPALKDLPIVVVSAKADEGQKVVLGQPMGVMDWLSKPVKIEQLLDIIQGLPTVGQRLDILHLEDDDDIAEIIALSLASVAHIVRANTVQQAKQFLQQRDFDMAILDVGLPDGEGTELLPLLADRNGRAVPVVLFTASDVTQEISAQVNATLIKSRTSEDGLLETIRHMITLQGGETAPERIA